MEFMKWPVSIILPGVFLLTVYPGRLGAEIRTRVLPDGSVEYYNSQSYSRYGTGAKKRTLPPSKYDALIESAARKGGVDPYLIKCIIKVESDFNADAVSVAGAMGLMQLMQDTAKYYNVRDPLDPGENLRAGVAHIRELLNSFKDDVPLALAAYHAGASRVKKRMAVPPIKSTVAYVNTVMALYAGGGDYTEQVKMLYKKIDKDGTIQIYSR